MICLTRPCAVGFYDVLRPCQVCLWHKHEAQALATSGGEDALAWKPRPRCLVWGRDVVQDIIRGEESFPRTKNKGREPRRGMLLYPGAWREFLSWRGACLMQVI